MRHRKHHSKMNREIGHRTATLRNLTRGLILQQDASGAYLERIETVATKAKTLRPYVEKLITLGKKGTLHHRRQAFAILQDKEAVHRIFEDLAKRYANRPGGYTRILHTRRRMGDGVEMAYIEMIDRPVAAAPAASSEAEATANA